MKRNTDPFVGIPMLESQQSQRKFGRDLIDRGEKMHYLRDLSWLFRGGA